MQITEALLSEPGDIRRFVQQAVDHWPHLLAFYFTLHSAEGNIGNDSNLLIVFYVQIMPDDFVMQLHRF
ncbi:hypothetical protein JQN47_21185 [Escherichia coli]|nr:hypothetical protein [Escherichia coli]